MSLSFGNVAYLTMVLAGFTTFAVVLFSGWVWSNWPEWTSRPAPASKAVPESRAHDYSRAA